MRIEDRSPLDPLLGPDATTKHLTVSHPLHQSDVARVRFGASLFSILSLQKLGTRHEHYATLSANSGGVVEASVRQYFPTLSASPAIIAGQADVLPSRGRQASQEVVGGVFSLTQS